MAGRILAEDIEEVRTRANLGEIAAEYMQVKRAGGARLKALCPFHPEKTPSFSIDASKGVYYCFGCSEGGNVYTLLMKLENLSFAEAVERLAGKVGVTLRYEAQSASDREASGKRQKMVAAHREAVAFYHDTLLKSDEAKDARDYLKQRGFTRPTAVTFEIGFSPKGGQALLRHLRGKGFNDALLLEAGLARSGNDGTVDAFRGRLMFPIHDLAGDPVAFGARVMGDGGGPKYLNTAESPIWHKGRVLYAMHLAKANVVREGRAVVVEGYTDVIALHQAGIGTAVASCGTALGLEHFKVLRRFTERAILSYDADQAGQTAAARAFEEAFAFSQEAGIDTRVLTLPEGQDPADFVTEKGAEAFAALEVAAIPVIEYRMRRELAKFDLSDAETRARGLRAALPILRQVNDDVLRRAYARHLASWTQVDADVVILELERGPRAGQSAAAASVKRASAQVRLEREALKLALQHLDVMSTYVDQIEVEDFSLAMHRAIWEEIRKGDADPGALVSSLADAHARKAVTALALDPIAGEVSDKLCEEICSRLKEFALARQIEEVKGRLQKLNPLTQEPEYRSLQHEWLELEGRRRELSGGGVR